MTLDHWVSLASTLISFVGLLLVVIQLRDNTAQRREESLLQIYSINREILTLGFANPELFHILHGKTVNPILEAHYLQLWFNQFALIHSFYGRKLIPADMRASLERDLQEFMSQENARRHWLEKRQFYPASFQIFVDTVCSPEAGAHQQRPPGKLHLKGA